VFEKAQELTPAGRTEDVWSQRQREKRYRLEPVDFLTAEKIFDSRLQLTSSSGR
jgi:hypothetical protein